MSKRHGAREQKRLAKQKAKQNSKRRQLAIRTSTNPAIRLKEADRWPIVATLVPDNLWEAGIGNLVIARRVSAEQLACAIFLLDVFCLGVKDALWKIITPGEFKTLRKDIEAHCQLQTVPPEYFAKLVYRAADYGQSLGFPPHRDFRHAQRLLAGIDPSQCPDEFQFGQDGRPVYFRGPGESLEEAKHIATRVTSLGGHYTVMLKSSEIPPDFEVFDETMDEDEDEDYEFATFVDSADQSEDDEVENADHEESHQPHRLSWLPRFLQR